MVLRDVPYLLKSKTRFFPLNLALKYVRSSYIRPSSAEPDLAKPDHSEPEQVESNQGLHREIVT
jgi:hypothetical protein